MEENKVKKISLSTFFLILAIIVIVVMAIFMYKIYNEKIEANKKSVVLQSQVNNLNETVSELQEKINKVTENVNLNNSVDSAVITNTENNNVSSNSNDSDFPKEYIKIINRIENDYSENDITCDLIYFNDDNIPDLVIGNSGYWVSLYIYKNGEVYNPIDEWAYDTGGNSGYKYQEKKETILNYNTDFAGAIISKTISILNSKNKFDTLIVTQRGAIDEDANYEEINKALEAYGGYFYNDQKISEQEYNNKLKVLSINIDENNSKELNGNRTTVEVKKQLQQ